MIFYHFGNYILLLKAVFRKPEKFSIYKNEIFREMVSIGLGSLGIISIISIFIGAVTTVQTAFQLTSDLIPKSIIGGITRDSTILELSPTVCSLVLAGKIGSSIASQIGTMRVTEQIDALEIMGINAPGYLILPKLLGGVIMIPMLVIVAIFLSITGGYFAGVASGAVTAAEFIQGLSTGFVPFTVFVALIKALIFAFEITTISAYQGFYTKGGALEVGQSSTKAVVISCIAILVSDYIIAQLLL
ncbi:MAG: ABC transporter permease [Bacteroidetes bacterium]|nr:ABC transporter permease [Pseudopedobacter sp.]MBU0697493.1 ABC transporter permease [Bacteroidota bacterium]MBU1373681.1 ABC transporter permease [Bacteroidota bacterium]MBU1485165.1 ABC transporter permease [Bacteroidota bacterium]MBU1760715.1 ABC transporter permease [Bacteroidota bacterium]